MKSRTLMSRCQDAPEKSRHALSCCVTVSGLMLMMMMDVEVESAMHASFSISIGVGIGTSLHESALQCFECSAKDQVRGQAAFAGFLILGSHVLAGLGQGGDGGVEVNAVPRRDLVGS